MPSEITSVVDRFMKNGQASGYSQIYIQHRLKYFSAKMHLRVIEAKFWTNVLKPCMYSLYIPHSFHS